MKRLKKTTSTILVAVVLLSNSQSLVAYANEEVNKISYQAKKEIENNKTENIVQKERQIKNDVVNIPDTSLKKLINKKLGQEGNSEITKFQLLLITELNAHDYYINDIENLEGIQYCTNLESLSLDDNDISDIIVLQGLNKLKDLSLRNNNIEDITHLQNLVNLETLSIGINNITDISSLQRFVKLKELYAEYNNISNIDVLNNMSSLNRLDLRHNKVKDINSMQSLNNLNSAYLNDNNITNIDSLGQLHNLKYLELDNNSISDISALAKIDLIEVTIKNQNIVLNDINIKRITNIEIKNIVKTIDGISRPIAISNEGKYDENSNELIWDNIESSVNLQYIFKEKFKVNEYGESVFNGTITQPVICDEKL